MCLSNGEEASLSMNGWAGVFPNGLPGVSTTGTPWIDPSLLHGKKGGEKRLALEGIIKSAQNAQREDWCQHTPTSTWLNVKKEISL